MDTFRMAATNGGDALVSERDISALRARLRGPLVQASESGYEEARALFNAMIDRRPALVARCHGAADVMAAVNFVRDHDVLVSVKGGGHGIAGKAVCDGGLLIDMSQLKSIRVDPAARTARVEPGVLGAELDRETQAFGLATPVGTVSTTGIAGLTLAVARAGSLANMALPSTICCPLTLSQRTGRYARRAQRRTRIYSGVSGALGITSG